LGDPLNCLYLPAGKRRDTWADDRRLRAMGRSQRSTLALGYERGSFHRL